MELTVRKLEIGCGPRPTPGYLHNDLNNFEGVDFLGNPWDIDLPVDSVDEVIALGVMEHLTYGQFDLTLLNVRRMLTADGIFLFDVPDTTVWCQYVVDHFNAREIPFSIDHVFATLYGWQRWPGDEHKSGWYQSKLESVLKAAGFATIEYGVHHFLDRGFVRNRMSRPADAHFYCLASG